LDSTQIVAIKEKQQTKANEISFIDLPRRIERDDGKTNETNKLIGLVEIERTKPKTLIDWN
jgi:hypothetical protein